MNPVTPAAPVFEAVGLGKRFPGVLALDGVSLSLRPGETHALLGENGAGKSTLVRILAGVHAPDAGAMRLAGVPYAPRDPGAAIRAGVRVVHQELSPLPGLTVAENLLFGRLPRRRGLVDRRALNRRAAELLAEIGLADLAPTTPVDRLGIAHLQLLEIARAMSRECAVLVLDEPTATLTPRETERLFALVRRVTARGTAVLFISHHLAEVFAACERMTVLLGGRHVVTRDLAGVTTAEVIRLMVGRDLAEEYPPYVPVPPGPELLRVTGLTAPGGRPASFALRAGEVVGVAGLVGSGRTETVRALFGADRAVSGEVRVAGRPVRIRSPRDAVRHGIGLLTEDRKAQGLVPDRSVAANLSLASLRAVSRAGFLRRRAEERAARDTVADLGVRTPGVHAPVGTLSGGNQQKVLLGRWLRAESRVLIVDEPTRGVDVGARHEIHGRLRELAARGRGLLVVSSDLPELLGICDRILVFSRGGPVGEVPRAEFDASRILALAYSAWTTPPSTKGDTP
ncbi:sugar ABC transporter ATP-binding protein (plasmid) [Streptomyces sp. BI20]|uniref:sugar ABC transporter ATP-binding protein n=1 Tax=Streptomyces sp. BI20 TaxID=3403460 RepID=UPI003C723EC3